MCEVSCSSFKPSSSFCSWGLQQSGGAIHKTLASTGPKTPTSSREGENPWARRSSESQAVRFSSIVEDEIQQRESFVRATNKPLALIQVYLQWYDYVILIMLQCIELTQYSEHKYSVYYNELLADRGACHAGINVPVRCRLECG